MLGTGELIIVLVVVVLVFGASKIPQLGDGLGKAIRNFKSALGDGKGAEGQGTAPAKKDEPPRPG
jgi:sec-independent protein translocase protein TatA